MIDKEDITIDGGQEPAEETAQPDTSSAGDSLESLRLDRYHSSSAYESIAGADSAQLFDELSREIRRMGREMFRTNRVAERNQEIFVEAIDEIRQISSTIALIPDQNQEHIAAVKFEARAELCRDLLRMSDTLGASILAADELITQLQKRADQPRRGPARKLAFRFSATRELSDSLVESVAAMKQWREGQSLLAERLQTILRTAGVREIETTGRLFDPQMHRAVSVAEGTNLPAGTIIGEELKGYTLDGHILRYAEVIVAK